MTTIKGITSEMLAVNRHMQRGWGGGLEPLPLFVLDAPSARLSFFCFVLFVFTYV